MIKIEENDLNILQKFCDNRIDYEMFLELTDLQDDTYSIEKWNKFKLNSVRFITSESFSELFSKIIQTINKNKYKG